MYLSVGVSLIAHFTVRVIKKETFPPLDKPLSVFIEGGCSEEILEVAEVSLRFRGALWAEANLLRV